MDRKVFMDHGAIESSWDNIPQPGLGISTATVNSLHSSSHSSSSNQSTGEPHTLGYMGSQSQSSIIDRDRYPIKSNRVGAASGFSDSKGASYSQPFLHNAASNSSSSSESVASWPGPIGVGHTAPPTFSISGGPPQPPPYQPPPDLHLTNGKDYGVFTRKKSNE